MSIIETVTSKLFVLQTSYILSIYCKAAILVVDIMIAIAQGQACSAGAKEMLESDHQNARQMRGNQQENELICRNQ